MKQDVEMTFGEHLEELRRRVIYALIGLLVATVFCAVNYPFLLSAMLRPYKLAYDEMIAEQVQARETEETAGDAESATAEGETETPLPETPLGAAVRSLRQRLAAIEKRLDAIAPQPKAAPDAPEEGKAFAERFPRPRVIQGGPLTGYVTVILLCLICGIILGSPWILYQIWAFVGVGLHRHERTFIHIYGPFSFCLFIGGAATFYFVMLKYGLRALMGPTIGIMVDGVPLIDPSLFLNDYFKFVAMMTLIFGVVFQTPLIVMFLARTEIVPLGTLVRKQRIVLLILVILSAVLTPQDPVTMVMMAIPLVVLYQLGLLLSWISIRRRRRRQAREEGEEPPDDGGPEQEGPRQEPDAGEQEPSAEPEPEETATAEEQDEDQAEEYEDPYAEFQGDDEDYAWEQEPYGETETDEQEPSDDSQQTEPGDEDERPSDQDEAPGPEVPDETPADDTQDEFDEMPSEEDIPPEDRMK